MAISKQDCYKFKELIKNKNMLQDLPLAFVTLDCRMVDIPYTLGAFLLGDRYFLQISYRGSKVHGNQVRIKLWSLEIETE